ncbi:MAG: tRNA uridine-5-carboxymethylaminomethyl(34) synthesis GTPase MnmE [Chitinophagaceae bacterium]|nr:tRNA uridine-5-carboxymethylaminomethyl(34) synthesis GTPase MnmE [Chitinophagaceae bacterium]
MLSKFSGWDDTIVAIATPQGLGAIGVIRLSGPASVSIINKLFSAKDLNQQPSHTLHVGLLKDGETVIDEVVVSLFKAPKSYTKEDVVEISCHGSPYVLQQIIQACLLKGARLAKAGEFTQRAFINGRFDLSQAEAVADLIASENQAQHDIALQQMKGGFSDELQKLREKLIHFTAFIELELDFAEEDVEFVDRTELKKLIAEIKNKITELSSSFQYGNVVKNGVPTVIIGRPNAGKSTLLNALLNEERAIVSPIAGTTRDAIEEVMVIDGISFRFIDTAGIREAGDQIEKIGIEKTFEKIALATVVIYLFDFTQLAIEELHKDLESLQAENRIIISVANKLDLAGHVNDRLEISMKEKFPGVIHMGISAKEKTNLDFLKKEIVQQVNKKVKTNHSVIVTNARHYEALNNALAALAQVEDGLASRLSGDLLTMDIKKALHHIGEITGQIDVDTDILGTIFSKFCIGK